MRVKLIKTEDGYNLATEQPQGRLLEATCSPSQEKKLFKSGATAKKLSLKNCQAIELGYDLDELADEHCNKLYHEGNINWDHYRVHFKEGFKKALSILSDKKFSEQQVRRAISAGLSIGYGRQFEIENKQIEVESYMKSLQQTEWDVEIVTEDTGLCANVLRKLKLDGNGCLILKRV